MVSGEMIWRCRLEVRRGCSSSCLLLESRVCHSCTRTMGHSSWGQLSRSPLQLQFLWVTVAPVTGVWREKTVPSVLFCVPPAAQVVTKAGSRGPLGSMDSAECKTRDRNIQGEDTCQKAMKYWEQKPRENSGWERAERPGDGCFIALWFVLHVLCLLLLQLPKWKASKLKPWRARPASHSG